jgi:ferrochelatase
MQGILLINLGSPKKLELNSVKSYLKEFLSDDLVIDLPKPIQKFLVNFIIVPTRSRNISKLIALFGQQKVHLLLKILNL